jgi:hypothetical protein
MQVRISEFVKNAKLTIKALQDVKIGKTKVQSKKEIEYNRLLKLSEINERMFDQWINIFLATKKIEISGDKQHNQEVLTETEEVLTEETEIV